MYIGNSKKKYSVFVKTKEGKPSGFKFFKVCDSNTQERLNVDFTMGAYKHFLKSFGYGDLTAASSGASKICIL